MPHAPVFSLVRTPHPVRLFLFYTGRALTIEESAETIRGSPPTSFVSRLSSIVWAFRTISSPETSCGTPLEDLLSALIKTVSPLRLP